MGEGDRGSYTLPFTLLTRYTDMTSRSRVPSLPCFTSLLPSGGELSSDRLFDLEAGDQPMELRPVKDVDTGQLLEPFF
jgi:hypothetical protein